MSLQYDGGDIESPEDRMARVSLMLRRQYRRRNPIATGAQLVLIIVAAWMVVAITILAAWKLWEIIA